MSSVSRLALSRSSAASFSAVARIPAASTLAAALICSSLGPGGLDELGGLLLGEPEQLLDPRAEPGVAGAFLLLDCPWA